MDLPKISIITPSFNQGIFIEKTILSVLNQGYPNLEYWVIDGGSTDNTLSILKKYKSKINFISEIDHGQTDAINKGLKRVTGDIIGYINSDDLYTPHSFVSVAQCFQQNKNVEWITGSYEIIDENGVQIRRQHIVQIYKDFLLSHFSPTLLRLTNSIVPQPSTFWSRKAFQKVGYFNSKLKFAMDYDYWLRLSRVCRLHYIPKKLSKFRLHSNSKSTLNYREQFIEEGHVLADNHATSTERIVHRLHTKIVLGIYGILK